jgi:D-glycero-D-manno-heptose 1,7-bisphosphate phosphatase
MSAGQKAVFLDRDGTISLEMGYIHEADMPRYGVYPRSAAGLKKMKEAGYLLVMVTNQSGVARGYYGPEMVERVHSRLAELLAAEGAALDAVYYCPFHPDPFATPDIGEAAPGMSHAKPNPAFAVESDWRKPQAGMGWQAAKDLGLDLGACWMVGDKSADLGFAKALGVPSILVRTGYGEETLQKMAAKGQKPERVADDLLDACRFILGPYPTPGPSPKGEGGR